MSKRARTGTSRPRSRSSPRQSDRGPDKAQTSTVPLALTQQSPLEHDRVGELLIRLRVATDDYHVPVDGCASYRACFQGLAELEADTHLHVHKENNVLFPAVEQLEEKLPVNAGNGARQPSPSVDGHHDTLGP